MDFEKTVLQQQLFLLLKGYDRLYGAHLWALEHALRFSDDNCWERLLNARGACESAILFTESLKLPPCGITEEIYTELLLGGLEADVVLMEWEQFPTACTHRLTALGNLRNLLADDIFLTPNAKNIRSYLENCRDNCIRLAEYAMLTANYLLLQLEREDLWRQLLADCPTLSEVGQHCWLSDPDQIMAAVNTCLDRIAAGQEGLATYLGIGEYSLGLVKKAAATGNFDSLNARLNSISGEPTRVPMPLRSIGSSRWYYFWDREGKPTVLIPGETLPGAPVACRVLWDKANGEALEKYLDLLRRTGFGIFEQQEGDTRKLLIYADNVDILLSVTPGRMTMTLSAPIPSLAPAAYIRRPPNSSGSAGEK